MDGLHVNSETITTFLEMIPYPAYLLERLPDDKIIVKMHNIPASVKCRCESGNLIGLELEALPQRSSPLREFIFDCLNSKQQEDQNSSPPSFCRVKLTDTDEIWGGLIGNSCILAVHRETPVLKNIQKSLVHNETLLNNMFNVNPDAQILADEKGTIYMANPAAVSTFGYENMEDLLKVPTTALYESPVKRKDIISQSIDKVIKNIKVTAKKKDGTVFPGLVSAGGFTFEGKVYYFGHLRDITDFQNLVERFTETTEKYQFLLENYKDGLMYLDPEHYVKFANQAIADILEIEKIKLIGTNATILQTCGVSTKFSQEIANFVQGDSSNNQTIKVKNSSDNICYYQLKRHELPGGFLIQVSDITTQQTILEEQRKMQRMEIVGRIAGQIAHDFNNLLSPLVGIPDVLRRKYPDDSQMHRLLNMIQIAANQMIHINQQLTTLSRCGHYKFTPINLNVLIENAVSLTDFANNIDCRLNLESELQFIEGDEAQLTRVMINLINNAIEAMGDSGILTVSSRNICLDKHLKKYMDIPPGDYVQVAIIDTGPGVNPSIGDKIFEPFFTTKKSSQRRGLGLGLSAVLEVLQDHNGYIDFENIPEAGAAFTVYLPILHFIHQIATEAVPKSKGNENILVVDDNLSYLEIMEQMLIELDYRIIAVSNASNAMQIMKNKKVELVLLDMNLEDTNGIELLLKIKEINPSQKAVLISAYADSDTLKKALDNGFAECLTKPVEHSKLAHTIRKVLDQ